MNKTKICEECKQTVTMVEQVSYVGKWKNKVTRMVALPHYCDGGESFFCNKMDREREFWNSELSVANRPYSTGFA
jgi:hypothetical protein